jgi:hypothetical protein
LTSGVSVNASLGRGNYNALFATIKMAEWHGLTMQSNFTWARLWVQARPYRPRVHIR